HAGHHDVDSVLLAQSPQLRQELRVHCEGNLQTPLGRHVRRERIAVCVRKEQLVARVPQLPQGLRACTTATGQENTTHDVAPRSTSVATPWVRTMVVPSAGSRSSTRSPSVSRTAQTMSWNPIR